MNTPMSTKGLVLSDTTPPSKSVSGSEFKNLMAEMAVMFPKLPPSLQDQAREAHAHVQNLCKNGQTVEATDLLQHMKVMMGQLIHEGSVVKQPVPVEQERLPSIPPIPGESSAEMIALKRSMEELQMSMKENAAVTAIAKRVRDMELEQRYASLTAQVREMKSDVARRIESVQRLSEESEVCLKREIRKRTVSRNPFCEHGPTGYCEYCVGKDDETLFNDEMVYQENLATPPFNKFLPAGAGAENLVNQQAILAMQNTLKNYQTTLKELLEERKRELADKKRT